MTQTTKWYKFQTHSGVLVRGDNPVQLADSDKNSHMHRAFYMTAQLEAPTWGTVQGYDGCGLSGGPFHWIATSPAGDPGLLFDLVRAIEVSVSDNNPNFAALNDAFKQAGCFLGKDGHLKSTNGANLNGKQIQNLLAPVNGVVPETGPNRDIADKWAILFHNLFADHVTYKAQTEYALSYLVSGYMELERTAYEAMFQSSVETIETITIPDITTLTDPIGFLSVDLAMCFYHSASVNAPGVAARCLREAMAETKDPKLLPKALIHKIGTQPYGAWRDRSDGNDRYDTFRLAAKKIGLWPEVLFNTIMPENLF